MLQLYAVCSISLAVTLFVDWAIRGEATLSLIAPGVASAFFLAAAAFTAMPAVRIRIQSALAARGEAILTAAAVAAFLGSSDAKLMIAHAQATFRAVPLSQLTLEHLLRKKSERSSDNSSPKAAPAPAPPVEPPVERRLSPNVNATFTLWAERSKGFISRQWFGSGPDRRSRSPVPHHSDDTSNDNVSVPVGLGQCDVFVSVWPSPPAPSAPPAGDLIWQRGAHERHATITRLIARLTARLTPAPPSNARSTLGRTTRTANLRPSPHGVRNSSANLSVSR